MGWLSTGLVRNIPHWLKNYDLEWYPEPTHLRPLAYARNYFADLFMQSERSHFWLIDADTEPPQDALDQLLAVQQPVVAAVVHVMKLDLDGVTKPVRMLMRQNGSDYYEAVDRGAQPVDRAGFGCVLFERDVFNKISFPWFEEKSWGESRGTDFNVCEKLEEAGIPIYGQFDVVCGHRKEVVY